MAYYQLLLLLFPISITVLAVIIASRFLAAPSSSKKPLPPGPKPWPIIGNLPHMGRKPHISFRNLSNIYGPLISLRLGSQLLVVVSSPAAAAEVLKTHDRLFSGRYVPRALPYDTAELDRKAVVWATNCNDQWKAFRTMFRNEIFSAKAIESQAAVREKKVAEMVEFFGGNLGESVCIREVVFATIFDMLSNLMFSRDFIGFERSLIQRLIELGVSPNLADFFPVMKNLDPQGLRREATRRCNELYSLWQRDVKERRERGGERERSDDTKDFLDILLENGLDDDQVDWLSLELFTAGTDTNTATIEWAMTELIRNRGVMNKLREELKREVLPLISGKPLIDEAMAARLPYLNAIVKETLRLHPPVSLLPPHRASESCELLNYTIPEGAYITVNVWAIGRDPTVWDDDPGTFKPERFIGSKTDFRAQHFELVPFGGGRRMCPGMPLSARLIPLVLAALVRNFDWCLPNEVDPAKLDMSEKFGLALQKELPLRLIPRQSLF
ncbi:unnamed protein product [Linum tenue]|uniref:Cytochrome P450 n=1 Tax=Linum tenue TaxID=586396 RepID=A0AAV0QRY0_9ROSI|nr:unnamed protein product [Linum tenue]